MVYVNEFAVSSRWFASWLNSCNFWNKIKMTWEKRKQVLVFQKYFWSKPGTTIHFIFECERPDRHKNEINYLCISINVFRRNAINVAWISNILPLPTQRKGEIGIVKIQFYISTNPFDLEGDHKKAEQMGKNSFQTTQKNATIMFYLVLFSLPFQVMWDNLVVVPTSKLFP